MERADIELQFVAVECGSNGRRDWQLIQCGGRRGLCCDWLGPNISITELKLTLNKWMWRWSTSSSSGNSREGNMMLKRVFVWCRCKKCSTGCRFSLFFFVLGAIRNFSSISNQLFEELIFPRPRNSEKIPKFGYISWGRFLAEFFFARIWVDIPSCVSWFCFFCSHRSICRRQFK